MHCYTGFSNDTPREYFCHLGPDGRRRDADERPELCRGSVEFVATKEFLVCDFTLSGVPLNLSEQVDTMHYVKLNVFINSHRINALSIAIFTSLRTMIMICVDFRFVTQCLLYISFSSMSL